jgi:hypothetical protein
MVTVVPLEDRPGLVGTLRGNGVKSVGDNARSSATWKLPYQRR